MMKYVLVIGDGMADTNLDALDGKTPLESLALPAFDAARPENQPDAPPPQPAV